LTTGIQIRDYFITVINDSESCKSNIIACADVNVCDKTDSPKPDYFNCKCDVVVGFDTTQDQLFFSTVAYDKNNGKKDVKVFGLLSDHVDSNIFGIPVNTVVHAQLVPRFKTLEDFIKKIEKSIIDNSDVVVDFNYAPSNKAEGIEGSFIVDISFSKEIVHTLRDEGGIDTSQRYGDLASLRVTEPRLDIVASLDIAIQAGIILGPDDNEQIIILGQTETCGNTPNCVLKSYQFQLRYTELIGGVETEFKANITVGDVNSNQNGTMALQDAINAKIGAGIMTVSEHISNPNNNVVLLCLKFRASVTSVSLCVLKDCVPEDPDEVLVTLHQNEFTCPEGSKPHPNTVKLFDRDKNPYGLTGE
jgi:hypothetical protein